MKHRLVFAALIALLLGTFGAAQAQSAVDPTLLASITQAFDQTRASTSLHIESQQLIARESSEFAMQAQSSASWTLAAGTAGWNLSGAQTTLTQFGDTPTESTIEYVVLDGVTYLNLDGVQMGGGGQDAQTLPQGWFEVSAEIGDPAQTPMRGIASTENLAVQAFGGLIYPITAESVTSVVELPSDTIDGQTMQVYQISLDAQFVIDSDASALLSIGGGMGGFAGGAPPRGDGDAAQGQPPTDAQGQPPTGDQGQPPTGDQAIDPANVRITFAVYIGQDDGLVHRIYSVIEIVTNRDDSSQTTTTSIHDYSAFNQPAEITAPAVGA